MVGIRKAGIALLIVMVFLIAISCAKQETLTPEEQKVIQAAKELADKENELITKAKENNALKMENEALLAQNQALLSMAIDANASRDSCLAQIDACEADQQPLQDQIDSLQAENDELSADYNTLSQDYDYLNMSYTLLKNRPIENCSANGTNYTFYCPTMTYVDCIDPIPAQNKYLCEGTFSDWVRENCNITLFS